PRVLPILAEHIVVLESVACRQNVMQRRLLRRRPIDAGIAVGLSPEFIADAKFERMAVLPADGDLQHEMQVVETDIGRHLDDAQHTRRHVVDLDTQPCDFAHDRGRYSAACWNVSISSRPSRSTILPSLITQARFLASCRMAISAIGSLSHTVMSASCPTANWPTWPSRPTARAL